jgi:hypothetical protein
MLDDTTIPAMVVYLDWITRGRVYKQQHTEANYQQPYMPHELITSSDMQADDKLASYWGSTSNIHTRSMYTYMLIHILGCHATKLGARTVSWITQLHSDYTQGLEFKDERPSIQAFQQLGWTLEDIYKIL